MERDKFIVGFWRAKFDRRPHKTKFNFTSEPVNSAKFDPFGQPLPAKPSQT
ncbi:hypothetical protein [uncultured Campylobacter sp.]|uniref:hypothetical protein n=1 Tax=uncultured Campylobacter sp. TaxID=218934 RepID=UPI00260714D7|nr:hypothetical protein [uncultured Campylobacter sp.]